MSIPRRSGIASTETVRRRLLCARSIAVGICLLLQTQVTFAQTDVFANTPILEYYNSIIGPYFLSTPAEAALIDTGSAGPGWGPTGRVFYVEPLAYVFYGAPVCRFYGSVIPGPNSHFFTVDPGECTYLKYLQSVTPPDQKRWNFEGIAFPAGIPQAGVCMPPYGTPVYRFYNNGFARGIDSDHRYVTSPSDVLEMYGRGWTYEGVAFCALYALSYP